MIVLGIDVGIRVCGYVVCRVRNLDIEIIKEGEIKPCVRQSLPQRLHHIFDNLEKEISTYKPQAIIVEKLYSHYRHPTTLGVLSHVRGVIALLAFRSSVEFREYSPTRARKSFIGRGSADSARVKKMAENIMGRAFKSVHTADAFSLVVAFSHEKKMERVLSGAAGWEA
jgi:crossover junction endodeoxyribonuclease RuvC